MAASLDRWQVCVAGFKGSGGGRGRRRQRLQVCHAPPNLSIIQEELGMSSLPSATEPDPPILPPVSHVHTLSDMRRRMNCSGKAGGSVGRSPGGLPHAGAHVPWTEGAPPTLLPGGTHGSTSLLPNLRRSPREVPIRVQMSEGMGGQECLCYDGLPLCRLPPRTSQNLPPRWLPSVRLYGAGSAGPRWW